MGAREGKVFNHRADVKDAECSRRSKGKWRDILRARMQEYYRQGSEYHDTISEVAGSRPSAEEEALFRALAVAVGRDRPLRILEIGAGKAESAQGLLRRVRAAAYVALDPSLRAVRTARDENPGYSALVGDGTTLPFRDGTFDACFFNYVLEHSVDPGEFLLEATRVTAVGGVLGMIVPVTDLPWMLPASLRHRQRDVAFSMRMMTGRWLNAILIRYVPGYFSFSLVRDPAALSQPPSEFQPDDDQVYWGTSLEIAKFLSSHGCDILWSAGRDISGYIVNGRRGWVDAVRYLLFGVYRATLLRWKPEQYTTTVSLVARRQA